MKILTLWLGAFGFAMNKLIWENNPESTFYAYELNKNVVEKIRNNSEHPFFFKWYKLPENIEIVDNYDKIISDVDLLIIAIPAQFVSMSISWFKDKIKPGVTILNLAKWIDIKTNNPISKVLADNLVWKDYNYAVLSGWMIASEVVEGKPLGADLWITNIKIWNKIKTLLENNNFRIKICEDYLNIELYWSLKNIMAIMVGYYEWQGLEKSTIWFYLVNFYDEMKEIIKIYGWNPELDFSYYSLGWDIVATCFWNSRNRYFWKLLWSWKNITEVLEKLKSDNKHAEWYETLKAVYKMIKEKEGFETVKLFYSMIK